MVYRTEQDKINRREANRRYYSLEENKEQKREYMKKYNKIKRKSILTNIFKILLI